MAINVRLSPEAEQVLTDLAAAEGLSKNDVINRAILEKGARAIRSRDVRDLARAAIADYATLLDRLAQ
ncbi:MAG TPA: hypothetical protein VHM65_01735 [Candidatus Lustribacter sp.]|nr:hypothetical protein [Candidatus Lustribacter sp.]